MQHLGKCDSKKLDALEQAVAAGGFGVRTTLANEFYADHPKDSPQGQAYFAQNQKDAALTRINWLKTKLQNFKDEKLYEKIVRANRPHKGKILTFRRNN